MCQFKTENRRVKMSPKDTRHTDQSSHKVIEKRRRDRINLCLSELSQSVPAAFSKQTSGKLEKAEILEMTVDYLRAVQATDIGTRFETGEWFSSDIWSDFLHHYQTGYNDCIREILRYMTDVEGMNASDDRCLRIISYLRTKFKPDAPVSGGAAYRGALQRLAVSTPVNPPRASIDDAVRYSPYGMPNRSTGPSAISCPRLCVGTDRDRLLFSSPLSIHHSENNHNLPLSYMNFKPTK